MAPFWCSWDALGHTVALMEAPSLDFGRLWASFGYVLDIFWALLGVSWPLLGISWASLGHLFGALRVFLGAPWLSWTPRLRFWTGTISFCQQVHLCLGSSQPQGMNLRSGCTLVHRHSSSWLQRCVGWNSRHTIDADTTKAWNLSLDEPDAHHNLGLVLEHHILDFLSIFVCQATWPPTISNFSVCPMPFRISLRMHYHLIHGVCQ